MNEQPIEAIKHALGKHWPDTLLAVGALSQRALNDPAAGQCVTTTPEQAPGILGQHGVFDVAVLSGVLEELDRRDASGLLARLRDLHARRVILLVDHTCCDWSGRDVMALGFTRLHHWDSDQALYGFDIDTYKTTPDWLNPDYWANPELWDRHRW